MDHRKWFTGIPDGITDGIKSTDVTMMTMTIAAIAVADTGTSRVMPRFTTSVKLIRS